MTLPWWAAGGTLTTRPGQSPPQAGRHHQVALKLFICGWTGHGESITKVCLARSVLHHLETGDGLSSSSSPETAASASLAKMYERVGGSGGVIVVTKDGR